MTGGKDCKDVTKTPTSGEIFKIGQGISVKALHTPCHTQDSICYLFEDKTGRAVFTGDTLFIGGKTIGALGHHYLDCEHADDEQVVGVSLRALLLRCTRL